MFRLGASRKRTAIFDSENLFLGLFDEVGSSCGGTSLKSYDAFHDVVLIGHVTIVP